ncbi:MAG: IS630 family transposase [Nanoarchaeota archaeon]
MVKKGDGRSIPREALEHYRFQAVKLKNKGWKINKIAEAFEVTREAVSRWISKYKKQGLDSLKRTKANGAKPKLTIEEKEEILNCLKESAMEFGFETPLWTSKRVKQLIFKKFNISIHISKICQWFKNIRLSPQKPERIYSQKDERLAKKWLKEEWPKIQKHCRRWQAMLYFLDEAGVSLTPVVGTTWAPKGKTPKIYVTGNRGGFCASSAISPAGHMVFRIEKKRVNAQVHIDFLSKIILQHPSRKIVIIEDNAPAHKSKLIKEFEMSNKKRIAIYKLPPYSPDLNPDEHVWSYLKAYELKDHQAQKTDELKKLTIKKMQKIQQNQTLIKSFFMEKYVTLL